MTIRLGILGATRGLNFALAAVEHKLDLEVAAVCDYFPPLLEKVKANLPENSFSPAYYTDFSDMIQNTPLDAVVIANNANEHARYAIEALKHGLHVLSEVLPVQTPAEAVALCEAVEKSGKKYFYAENYCYMRPNFEAALRYRRGEIGTIVEGECDFVVCVESGRSTQGYRLQTGDCQNLCYSGAGIGIYGSKRMGGLRDSDDADSFYENIRDSGDSRCRNRLFCNASIDEGHD